jgi:succinyl-diaminopimelate desuccinylase
MVRIQLMKERARLPFADFTTKLAAKWTLRTQHTQAQPTGHEALIDILSDLIAIPTVTGNYEANHEALDYVDRFLSERGMYVKRHEWNGVESLVATTRRTKTPKVFLAAHMDVVAAPEEMFQLREVGHRYTGRGVLDMKVAIAAYLAFVKEIEDSLQDYDFGIMITTDEEIGGFDGAVKLAEEGYVPEVMVLPDGGQDWKMESATKGIWLLTLEANGRNAHGSRPWEGENAVNTLLAALHDMEALFPAPKPSTSTMSIGIIQGGEAINQVPASATASVDLRFISKAEQERLRAEIAKIAEHHNVTLITEVMADPVANDSSDPYLRAYAKCTEEVVDNPMEWVLSNAGNDGRFFAEKGVPIACSYPRGGNHHGPEEWVDKQAPRQLQKIVANFVNQVAIAEEK